MHGWVSEMKYDTNPPLPSRPLRRLLVMHLFTFKVSNKETGPASPNTNDRSRGKQGFQLKHVTAMKRHAQ